ncbi:MAG: hypothetical protein NW223_19355 [Hyphomicrobiaceae bacterium]|nr:hypothetical protein [Hyphomicrobiaceae bacterium]
MQIRSTIVAALSAAVVVWGPALAADSLVRKAAPAAAPSAIPAADRCARIEPLPGTPSVPGGDLFGFTDPTDIGEACLWGFSSEHSARAGKRDGRYFANTSKNEFGYTYNSHVAFAFAGFTAYNTWANVTSAQDALAAEGSGVALDRIDRVNFDGLSGEVLVRLLARSPGQPLALTAAVETVWSRIDRLTGYRAEGFGTEFKLLADVALTDRIFAAANVLFGLGTQKFDIPGAVWADGSALVGSLAVTGQLYSAEKQWIEGVFLGIEGRHVAAYSGLGLDQFAGRATFVGPTFAIAFAGDRMLNIAWTPQLTGRAEMPSAPGRVPSGMWWTFERVA